MSSPNTDDLYDRYNSLSHEQLLAMVKSADPTTLSVRGGKLSGAAGKLNEISAQLSSNSASLSWEGSAADSFKAWVKQVADATEQLGTYAQTTSDQLQHASTALGSAKAMPGVPQAEANTVSRYNAQGSQFLTPTADQARAKADPNWVTQQQAAQAQDTLAAQKATAVDDMVKLSQAYQASTDVIQAQTPPLFPPTPTAVMGPPPKMEYGGNGNTSFGGSGGSGGSSGGGGGGHTGTVIPPIRTAPTTPKPTPPGPVLPAPPSPTPPPYQGPPVMQPGPVHQPFEPPPAPDPTPNPTQPPGTGILSTPPGTTTPPPVSTGPTTTLPSGGPSGGPGFPIGGGPGLPGGMPPGFPGGLPGKLGGGTSYIGQGGGSSAPYGGGRGIGGSQEPFEEGISGGVSRPGMQSGRSQIGTNAIGAQEGEAGAAGGRAGGMPGGGLGGGGRGIGGGGSGLGRGGRGLVSKPGGQVGGRRGPAAEGEYTPGGSGLGKASAEARGEAAEGEGGFMPGGGARGAGKRKKDRGHRADYLLEDEETWTGGTPESNPDVIE